MENRYKISYDIKQKNIVNISFMQGDVDTSVIEIQLFDNGQVVDITGETIEFRFLKPDNTIVAQDSTTGVNIISASEGKFECILMANTLAVPGVVRTEIVRKKNNFILTCPTFYFTVKSSIGNTILSSNYIASIENKMIEWQLNEDLRQEIFENNEVNRERAFNTNETNRQSIFETNEANRQEIFETNEADRENRFYRLTTEQQQDAEVIDARDGEISLKARLDRDFNILKSSGVKRYGVRFEGSSAQGIRVEDAVGMIAQVAVDDEIVINDFDKVSFFNRPICCGYHDEEGRFHVNAYRGEPGFAWDGSNGEVYYECTPFYYKGDLHTYISVSATPLEGYKLAPMFKNGHDKVYCPVFPVAMVDGMPTSRAGVFPTYNSMNGHMTDVRKYHQKAHTETMAVRISEYMLMLVEFATKDLQSIMGGATNMPYSDSDAAVIGETSVNRIIIPKERAERFVLGQTISIGTSYTNSSVAQNRVVTNIVQYDDENMAIYFDGDPVDIAVGNVIASRPWKNGAAATVVTASSGSIRSNTDGKHPCIWRGRENPWGNAFSAICDVLIERVGEEGNYRYIPYYLKDPTKYANGAITEDYVKLNYELPTENGYVKTLGIDSRFPHVRLPLEIGASSTTYLCDYYWVASDVTVRAVFAGGDVILGRDYGPVCFACTSPSVSYWFRLAHLFVTP
mgnify:CR=1 FL=1